jgi:DNA-binding IclR family transcriptional regulator
MARQTKDKSTGSPDETGGEGTGDYRVENVARAVDVLFVFSNERPQLSLVEIAEATNIPKPSLFRILWTLCDRNLLVKNPRTGFYGLGHGLLGLSYVNTTQQTFRAKTLPAMYKIRDAVNETVVFTIRNGRRRINVDYVESVRTVGRLPLPAFDVPLHAGAASRVLLAAMNDKEIAAYLDNAALEPLTGNTVTDRERLLRQVAHIRTRGYAMAFGEVTEGSAAIAVPVASETGEVFASIYVLFSQSRNTREHRYRCISALRAGARDIAHAMRFG